MMPRRRFAHLLAGLAVMAAPLAASAMPALAGAPGQESALAAASPVPAAAVDNEFRPMELTVTVGTSVVWTNEGQNPHTVTADDRAFDSGTLESGQTFSATFDEVGRVPYYCQIHGEPGAGMFGIVIVRAAQAEEDQEESPTDEAGGLAHTGLDPIPIALTVLGLAIAGLSSLGAARARGRKEVRESRGNRARQARDSEGRRT